MAGIIAFGAYVPRLRLQRQAIHQANAWFAPGLKSLAKGERAIANWDEDVVTMAVEAARDCLVDHERNIVRSISLASTSFPYADRQNSGIVKEALALPDAVATLDIGYSQKAGTGALLQALQSAGSASGPALVIASEKRTARPASEDEMLNADAAVGFLVGADDGIARFIGAHSVTSDFVDHFRAEGRDFDYGWESRWVRDEGFEKLAITAIQGALAAHHIPPERISRLLVGIPARGIATALAKRTGIPAASIRTDLYENMGGAGTAHALMLLAHALETAEPGQIAMVVGFGQGADVLLFEVTPAISQSSRRLGVSGWLAHSEKETNYLKYLTFAGHLKLELGKRAEFEQKPVLSALYRNRKAVLGLIGGRCTKTGTVQFPRSTISVDSEHHDVGTQEDYPLADRRARVLTYTADNLTFTPNPPSYYGMIEFEGGGRMFAEFTDTSADLVAVGAPMRMMFRVKNIDDRSGFIKYFWKAVPAFGGE
jgi:3-hydroxy-3-methylglutaryl CoA synthase